MSDSDHQSPGSPAASDAELTECDRLRQRILELERERVGRVPEIADVFAACADNIIVLDADLRIRFINWTVPDLTPAGVIGTLVYDLVPEDFRPSMRACFERVKSSARPDRYTTNYVAADGTVSFWESRVGAIIRVGTITGYVSISSNVTERNQEAADRDLLFNMSLDMLVVADLHGRFKSLNPAAERLLGYSIQELLGKPFIDFVHPDDREKTAEAAASLGPDRDLIDFVNRYRRKDGVYRWLSWRAGTDANRRLIHAVARDVTDHRNLEEQLRRSQKMNAIGQLGAGIAHDFNNLLLAIRANVSFTRGEESPEQREEYLDEIACATERASDLTRQLLAFASRQPMNLMAFDLNTQLEELLQLLGRLIPENITTDFIPGHHLPRVHADRSQIEQVVVNLCLNARDAMPAGGRLTLETETVLVNGKYRESHPWAKPGRYVLLSVTDSGTGMTREVQERIFEPFFTTKETGKGTGLGLAMVYGIVKQHGGMLSVYSEPNLGSTFKVFLPATERPAEQVGSKLKAAPEGGTETILVAEDDDMVRTVVVRILRSAGYRVLISRNGVEAAQHFAAQAAEVQLVILDVVMPLLGGIDALRRIRAIRADVPALFTSGYSEISKLEAQGISAQAILQKPYDPDDLLRRVRSEISASLGPPSTRGG